MIINRHLVIACAGFVAGFLLTEFHWINGYICVASLLLSLFLCFNGFKSRVKDEVWIFILFLSVASLMYLSNPLPKEGDNLFLYFRELPTNTHVELEGYVIKNEPLNREKSAIRFVLQVLRVKSGKDEWREIQGRILVLCNDIKYPVYKHTKVRVMGKPVIYLSPNNFSIYNYEDYLHSQRIYSKIHTTGNQIKIIKEYVYSPLFWISKVQQYFYEKILIYSPESTVDMAHAIWLGDRSGLSYEEKQPFMKTGTIHILAISGLHIGLLFWFTRKLWQLLFPFKGSGADIFSLIICMLYVLTSGAHGSSLRALLMLIIYLGYVLIKREEDLLSCLSLTVLILFTINPELIRDIGTQMSAVAVLSIVLFHKPITRFFSFLPWSIRAYLAVTISAQLLLLPLLVKFNPQLNLLSPLINLLVVPLMGLYLVSSLGGIFTVFIPWLPGVFFYCSSFFLWLIEWICLVGSGIQQSIVSVSKPTYFGVLFYFITCYLLYKYLNTLRKKDLTIFLTSCIILYIGWNGSFFKRDGVVHILDVSHGDAIFIRTPEGETLLVDSGTKEMGKTVVVPFLRAQEIRRLDYVIASHADEDHIGGLDAVIENFSVYKFLYGENFDNNLLGTTLLEKIKSKRYPTIKLQENIQIPLKRGLLEVLYTGRTHYSETNFNSVVVKFSYNNFSILLTGDFPADIAKRELNPDTCSAHVIKIPHHGLKNSLHQDLLEIVKPKIAIVSCNEFYRNFGLRREAKELLNQYSIPIWRTDYHGGIRIQFTPQSISISGARQSKGYNLQRR